MRKPGIWAAAGILLVCTAAQAEVRWLQYRTADGARDIVGGSTQFMRIDEDVPRDLALPQFESDKPLHFKWPTVMDPAGVRRIVFDKKHKYGIHDTLYIDADGDGRLDDEQAIAGRPTDQYHVEFNGVPLRFEGEDGPITYHLNLQFYSYNEESTYLYATTGCWYEGQVDIAGKPTRLVLVDYNCNGSFNDKSDDFNCDRVLTGPAERSHQRYVGNFVELDDTLYRFSAARDGAFVELTPAPDVAYATVGMPAEITSFTAGGINGHFEREVVSGRVKLPVGKYRLHSWTIERKDDKGKEWRLRASAGGQRREFEVAEGEPTWLNIGEPVLSTMEVSPRNGTYYLNQELTGRGGESITLYYKNGQRPPAPKVHVTNKTGEYDRTFSLEYG